MSQTSRFDCTHCLIRGLPSTFEDGLKLHPPPTPINFELAKKQHGTYHDLIRQLVPNVVEIEADDNHPDCCFVEDTVMIFGNIAVITRPGAQSRRGEVGPVKEKLQALGFPTIKELVDPACLDGGDVLFTGSSIWVGMTKRTNREAARQLQELVGPQLPVHTFEIIGGDILHLKCVVTAFDDQTIIVADNEVGRDLVAQVQREPGLEGKHHFAYVPDVVPANILRLGKHIVAQKGFPGSESVLQALCEQHGLTMHTLCMSELIKADGALTCGCVPFCLPVK